MLLWKQILFQLPLSFIDKLFSLPFKFSFKHFQFPPTQRHITSSIDVYIFSCLHFFVLYKWQIKDSDNHILQVYET